MSNRSSYMDDSDHLPIGLRIVYYDSERGIHQYRDQDGQLWESDPGNTYGVLHRVEGTPAYFNSARHTCPAMSTSSTPMTEFPDTWDPPADYEIQSLPSGKRIATKLGNYRRNIFSSLSRSSSAASQDSVGSSRGPTMSVKSSSGLNSTESFRSSATKSSSLWSPAASQKGRML